LSIDDALRFIAPGGYLLVYDVTARQMELRKVELRKKKQSLPSVGRCAGLRVELGRRALRPATSIGAAIVAGRDRDDPHACL
jgi:hypothetical protein